MANLHDWSIGAGYWQETLVPCLTDLPVELFGCLHNMTVGFSQSRCTEREVEAVMSLKPSYRIHTQSFP